MTESALTNVERIAQEIKASRERLNEEAGKAFQEGVEQIFATYPFLGGITWSQYTPYFNDGDPCVFRTLEVSIGTKRDVDLWLKNGRSPYPYDDEYYDEDGNDVKLDITYSTSSEYALDRGDSDAVPEHVAALKDANALFHALPDTFFEATYGDHMIVLLQPGQDPMTENYDHD